MIRSSTRLAVLAAAFLLLPAVPAAAAPAGPLAPISSSLAATLNTVADALPMTTMVHGKDLAAARDAVKQAGLTEVTSFRRIGVVVAKGNAGQVRAVRAQTGVTYVEGNDPIQLFADS